MEAFAIPGHALQNLATQARQELLQLLLPLCFQALVFLVRMAKELGRQLDELPAKLAEFLLSPGIEVDLEWEFGEFFEIAFHPSRKNVFQAEAVEPAADGPQSLAQDKDGFRIGRPARVGFGGGAVNEDAAEVVELLLNGPFQLGREHGHHVSFG